MALLGLYSLATRDSHLTGIYLRGVPRQVFRPSLPKLTRQIAPEGRMLGLCWGGEMEAAKASRALYPGFPAILGCEVFLSQRFVH